MTLKHIELLAQVVSAQARLEAMKMTNESTTCTVHGANDFFALESAMNDVKHQARQEISPRPWFGLTPQERQDISDATENNGAMETWWERYGIAIESALKAKNGAQPAQQERKPLTPEQIDAATSKARDELLDHIYEYGTVAEGIQQRVRRIARAVEAAHGIGSKT
jgi:hypothetical protein